VAGDAVKGYFMPDWLKESIRLQKRREISQRYAHRHPGYKTSAYRKARRRAIKALGGACVQCGNADIRALEIDHVNGGGIAERKRVQYYSFYVTVPTRHDLQILCANCHAIKDWERRHGHS